MAENFNVYRFLNNNINGDSKSIEAQVMLLSVVLANSNLK